MSQLYHMTMSNGQRVDFPSDCAANAIGGALKTVPGQLVVKCWLGDPFNLMLEGHPKGDNGRIDFNVPAHFPTGPHVPKKRARPPAELFNDAEILAESGQAIRRKENLSL